MNFKEYFDKTINEKWYHNLAMAGLLGLGGLSPETAEAKTPKNQVQPQKKTSKKPIKSYQHKGNFNMLPIINLIIKHEGLLPNQTPFRITNPDMKSWDTIHGYPIAKDIKKPTNRQNFIFLQKASDVPLAVLKQFQKYVANPKKYNLPTNVTLRQAIHKFDQTGAKSKLAYLKQNLGNINIDAPLKEFIQ